MPSDYISFIIAILVMAGLYVMVMVFHNELSRYRTISRYLPIEKLGEPDQLIDVVSFSRACGALFKDKGYVLIAEDGAMINVVRLEGIEDNVALFAVEAHDPEGLELLNKIHRKEYELTFLPKSSYMKLGDDNTLTYLCTGIFRINLTKKEKQNE